MFVQNRNCHFHIRARALLFSNGQILLAHRKGAANTYLPGGHVDPGESAKTTIVRELDEELGVKGKVTSFLGVVEHGYEVDRVFHQELNLIFLVEETQLNWEIPLQSKESHLEFFWCPINQIDCQNLQPTPFVDLIRKYFDGDKEIWWGCTLDNQ